MLEKIKEIFKREELSEVDKEWLKVLNTPGTHSRELWKLQRKEYEKSANITKNNMDELLEWDNVETGKVQEKGVKWLYWNSYDMAKKIYYDGVEENGETEASYGFLSAYMARHIKQLSQYEEFQLFLDYANKNKKNYTYVINGEKIFDRMHKQGLTYIYALYKMILEKYNIPFPVFIWHDKKAWGTSKKLCYDKKLSNDGLSLIQMTKEEIDEKYRNRAKLGKKELETEGIFLND